MLIYKYVKCHPQCIAHGLVHTQSIIAAVIIIIFINPPSDLHCDVQIEGHRHRWVALILNSVLSGSKDSADTNQIACVK